MNELEFFKGKRVLVTGHTGFKGSWLCRVLLNAGAKVTGYSRCTPKTPSLYELCVSDGEMNSIAGDVRDFNHLVQVFDETQPEIVLHLAAQTIVRTGYEHPVETYETNVLGTVNLLECVRSHPSVKSFLNVTTDKVYENREWVWGYRETDPLDGFDPYSNSKSCSELVTHSYAKSFFADRHCAVSTARAGNVIGGGDFARDRIIPDCIRAAMKGEPVIVRNPYSTRPYQHVLEPLMAYLMIVHRQYEDFKLSGYYNIGPDECDCVTTGQLTDIFCSQWGDGASWENHCEIDAPHEAGFLKLDCSKFKTTFGWRPRWHIDEAVHQTVMWTKKWMSGDGVAAEMCREIDKYIGEMPL